MEWFLITLPSTVCYSSKHAKTVLPPKVTQTTKSLITFPLHYLVNASVRRFWITEGVTSFHLAFGLPRSVELFSDTPSQNMYAWQKEQLPQQHVFVLTGCSIIVYQFLTSHTLGNFFCFWRPLISSCIQVNLVKYKGKVVRRAVRKWNALGTADSHLLYFSCWTGLEPPNSLAL